MYLLSLLGGHFRRRSCRGSLLRFLRPFLLAFGDPHFDDERERRHVHDHGDDNVGDVLIVHGEVGDLETRDIEDRHEAPGEDHGDGVVHSEQRHGNAVEARRREGLVRRPEELGIAREVIERTGGAGESARNGHRKDNVALIVDVNSLAV